MQHISSSVSSPVSSLFTCESSLEAKVWDEVNKVLRAKGLLNNFNISRSPLYEAVLLNDLDLCKKILEMGFPINRSEIHFLEMPLYQAMYSGNEEISLYLIEKGTDLSITDPSGKSYLHFAVECSLPQVVDALIQGGAFVNAQINITSPHPDLTCGKYIGSPEEPHVVVTPLYLALRQDDKANSQQIAVQLIKNGADITYKGPNGFNFLHLAAYKGYDKVCELLVEKGVDVNSMCDLNTDSSEIWKMTPLHFSVISNHVEATKILLEKGAKVSLNLNNMKYHPFVYGTLTPMTHEKIVQVLIKHGALEYEIEELGLPWILKFPDHYMQIFEKARKYGFNLQYKFTNQETYLHWAVRLELKDLCEWLIQAGINIYAVNAKKQNALHLAAGIHNQELITLFLKKGVEARCLDHNALTPLMHAEKNMLALDQYPELQIADRGLTSLMYKLRLLGLRYSLKGEAFEGSSNFLTYQEVSSSLDSYLKTQAQLPPFFYTLPNIIRQSFSDEDDIISRLEQKEIVSISSGWTGHAAVIVLTKKYLIKGNRGAGSHEESGMMVYKIHHPENLTTAIKTLLENKKWMINPEELWQKIRQGEKREDAFMKSMDSFGNITQRVLEQNARTAKEHYELIEAAAIKNHIQFFNEDLINLLGLEEIFTWHKKNQTAGNCTMESAKMVVNGILIAYYLESNPSITKQEIVSLCHEFISPWKEYDYTQSLTILKEAEKEPLIQEIVDFEKVYDELFVLNFFRKEALNLLCRQRPRLLTWIDNLDPKLMSYGYCHQNDKIIKWFLERGIEPDQEDLFMSSHPKIEKLYVDYLIKKGIKSNIQSSWGKTLLHHLCSKKDTTLVFELLKQWKQQCEQSDEMHLLTAALNTPDVSNDTPLGRLLAPPPFTTLDSKDIHSRQQIINLMIECGALSLCNKRNILFDFIIYRRQVFDAQLIEIVKSLLQCSDASLAITELNACLLNLTEINPEVLKILMQAGFKPSSSSLDMYMLDMPLEQFKLCLTSVVPNTCMMNKAMLFEKPIEIIQALLDAGVEGDLETLEQAISYDNAEMIKKIINKGVVPKKCILTKAIHQKSSLEVIRTLLLAGIIPDDSDLINSIFKKCSIEIIQALLKAGAKPSTAIIQLAENQYPEAVQFLQRAIKNKS